MKKFLKAVRKYWLVIAAAIAGLAIALGVFMRNRKSSKLAQDWLNTQQAYYKEMAEHAKNRASLTEIKKELKDAEVIFVEAKKEVEALNSGADERRRALWKRAFKSTNN